MEFTKSTQRVIEELQRKCFEIQKSGNVYRYKRNGTQEIKFVEGFSGEAHLFQVNGRPCHSIGKALDIAEGRM